MREFKTLGRSISKETKISNSVAKRPQMFHKISVRLCIWDIRTNRWYRNCLETMLCVAKLHGYVVAVQLFDIVVLLEGCLTQMNVQLGSSLPRLFVPILPQGLVHWLPPSKMPRT